MKISLVLMCSAVLACASDATTSSQFSLGDAVDGGDALLVVGIGSRGGGAGKDIVIWSPSDGVTGGNGDGDGEGDGSDAEVGPAPGEFGYPCDGNEDCLSGFCVDSEDGKVCTEVCLENCPQGWECAQVSGLGGDVIYICVSKFANLCKPCTSTDDCSSSGGLEGNACVDSGGNGYFCGVPCDEDTDCPETYTCQDVVLESGADSQQCVKSDGQCECTETFIQEEASTTCYKSNDDGTCYGDMICGPDGLTECTAPPGCTNYWLDQDNDGYGLGIPECLCEKPGEKFVTQGGDCNDSTTSIGPEVDESCNGLDDDCDGLTDEVDALGCTEFFLDEDEDGFGDEDQPVCACSKGDYASTGTDCDDSSAEINTDAQEICNFVDDDCDGDVDEENALMCQVYFFDQDGDGYGLGDTYKCLCTPEWPYSAPEAGECDDDNDSTKPFAQELCDAVDNDCDGETDEGEPEELCGVVDNGVAECVEGACKVTDCEAGYYDIDFQPLNGCECIANSVEVSGENCQEAVGLGTVSDDGITVQRQGNAVYEDESDWYSFFGADGPDAGCDTYHVRVRFLWNPNDAYTFDIHRGSCAAGDQVCLQVTDYSFFTDFTDAAEDKGECPCVTDAASTAAGVHECSDNSSEYYIRVYRKPEVGPDCQGYALEVTNGVY